MAATSNPLDKKSAHADESQGPWPYFAPDEIKAAAQVLASGKVNYWTGQEGREFEKEFARYTGTDHAVALANGTLALEACLHALNIGPGDEVVVTPRSFVASATCVVTAGATPVFADVDPVSGNLTAETIDIVCTPKTKAVILVHLAGWPCEMDQIVQLAKARNLYVVEDCAQAHAAEFRGQKVGSFGHVNSWSFCQDKIMTTGGEGGMVTTDDPALWEKVWSIKDHGKNYNTVYKKAHPPGFRWLHESVGSNWRLTEIQSAIGRLQLQKLDQWVESRRLNAQILQEGLYGTPGLNLLDPPAHVKHAYYRFYCAFEPQALKSDWNQQRLITEINDRGVSAFSGSCSEIYLEKVFQDLGLGPKHRLPNAQKLGETSLVFLVHPTLSESYLHQTVEAVRSIMKKAVK